MNSIDENIGKFMKWGFVISYLQLEIGYRFRTCVFDFTLLFVHEFHTIDGLLLFTQAFFQEAFQYIKNEIKNEFKVKKQ